MQAIRITWNEAKDGTGIEHKATYLITDDKLRNLKSGYKYIWNIELRRGTLAIVRTEIVDWIVPSNELEYTTDGVWYAMPLADALASLLSFTLLVQQIRKMRRATASAA